LREKRALFRGDHFWFGSVFSQKIQPNLKKKDPKLNRNRPKPTGFGPVFYPKNWKYAFFWTFFGFIGTVLP